MTYPSDIPSLPIVTDNVDYPKASDINTLSQNLTGVMNALGIESAPTMTTLLSAIYYLFKTSYDAVYRPIGGADKYPMEARLTLEAGVPISTTDQTAKTTLYLTKYKGDQIAVYDGSSAWSTIALGADLSITLAGLTAGLPYDVFVYSNAGTLTLELTAWTNTTTRATALTTQNGIYVKTGATTRRYLGTICIKATGQCEDSKTSRLVWNYYNRTNRNLLCQDTTGTWNYTTATWRAVNNNTTLGVGRVDMIIGIAEDILEAFSMGFADNSSPTAGAVGVGLDSTSANSASMWGSGIIGTSTFAVTCQYIAMPAVGYHYLQRLEYSAATGTTRWTGNQGGAIYQCGMIAKVMA